MKKLVLIFTLVLGVISASWANNSTKNYDVQRVHQTIFKKNALPDTIHCVYGLGIATKACGAITHIFISSLRACHKELSKAEDEAQCISQSAADKKAADFVCPEEGEEIPEEGQPEQGDGEGN